MPTPTRHYPPTPWINAVHPLTQDHYKFRLSRTRRGGKITLTLAKDSPTAQAQTRKVQPSRIGWWEFVQAADRLLTTSRWDTTCNPDSAAARSQWNQQMRDYATHADDVTTVLSLLPQLLDGTRRPITKILQESAVAAKANGGTTANQIAARTNRYQEIMTTAHKIVTILNPLRERMQDARRMKGYTAQEVSALLAAVEVTLNAAQSLSRMARANSFGNTQPALRITSLNDPKPFELDTELPGTALTPAEQATLPAPKPSSFSDDLDRFMQNENVELAPIQPRKTTFGEDLDAWEKTFVPPAPKGFQIGSE